MRIAQHLVPVLRDPAGPPLFAVVPAHMAGPASLQRRDRASDALVVLCVSHWFAIASRAVLHLRSFGEFVFAT
jgi:hypothetical protein